MNAAHDGSERGFPAATPAPRPGALARWFETMRRLRASQVGHRLVARLRAALPAPAAGPSAWRGAPPLPDAARRPTTFPWDGPDGAGWRFAGAVAEATEAGLRWASPPSLLSRYHAAYAEVVAARAQEGDLAGARRWLHAVGVDAPRHPFVASRRLLALVEAEAAGLVEVRAQVAADAAALLRAPEWDVRGNHLVANGAALFRGGAALGGSLGRRCLARGAAILSACVREQVLPDGVHYERSPVYQDLVLELLLVALETAAARGVAPPPGVEDAARRLAVASEELLLPDGAPVRWRDGAPGLALPRAALATWAARRAGPLPPRRVGSRTFPHGGLAILEAEGGALTLVGAPPCPRDLPAHGHADALAFEWVDRGVRIVGAAGTAAYAAGPDRDRDRRPGAFAGLLVDGAPSADPYGAFRVGARGFVRHLEVGAARGWVHAAAHASFPGTGVVVRRLVARTPRGAVVVLDEAVGPGASCTAFAPLHPDAVAEVEGEGARVVLGDRVVRVVAPGGRVEAVPGVAAVAMGATRPRTVLRIERGAPGPCRHALAFVPGDGRAEVSTSTVLGGEVRVVVRSGDVEEVGFVPAGHRP